MPANSIHQPIHSIATQPSHAEPPGTDPATANTHQQASTRQQRRPRIPLPIPAASAETDHRKIHTTEPNTQPSKPRITKQQRFSQNALPKPDANFNEHLPCGRPEASCLGPTGTRPCRVGSSAFQRGNEPSGANHRGQGSFQPRCGTKLPRVREAGFYARDPRLSNPFPRSAL